MYPIARATNDLQSVSRIGYMDSIQYFQPHMRVYIDYTPQRLVLSAAVPNTGEIGGHIDAAT